MAGIKLYYFDAAGLGEQIRLAFRVGEVPFEDVRFSSDQWKTEPTWKERAPAGQAPYLELEDGRLLCESNAILMYAAARANLIPADAVQAAFAHQAVCLLQSMFAILRRFYSETEDKNDICAALKTHCAMMDKIIEKTQSADGYVVGHNISYADLFIFTALKKALATRRPELVDEVFAACPTLKRICEVVESHPKVKAYYA